MNNASDNNSVQNDSVAQGADQSKGGQVVSAIDSVARATFGGKRIFILAVIFAAILTYLDIVWFGQVLSTPLLVCSIFGAIILMIKRNMR